MPFDASKADEIWQRYQYIRDNGHLDYVAKARRCEDFFAGLQWDASDLALLKQHKRPALTINKIISTVANVMGEQIFNRTEIAFRPRRDATQQLADTLSKVFMQIGDNNQLEWTRSDVFADGVIGSRGYYDVRLAFRDSLAGEVEISQLNPKNVLVDPDAEEYDPDKWGDVYVTKWMSTDMIAELYNKADAKELERSQETYFPYGYDSVDRERDRFGTPRSVTYGMGPIMVQGMVRHVRVIERQYRKNANVEHFANLRAGDLRAVPQSWDRDRISMYLQANPDTVVIKKVIPRIRWTVIADKFVLHDDWSPYKHFTVVPFFPFFRRGRTVGLVENLLGPQELLNKVSSQELHVVNTSANSGWKVKTGALKNMDTSELEARGAQTGLVLELDDINNADKIQPNQVPSGLDRISYKAEEHIKTISGVSDYRTGNAREDVAAKAVKANQAAGSANTAKVMDNLMRTDHILARNVLDLVQEFYTEERVLNIVTDRLTNAVEPMTVNEVQEDGNIGNDLTVGEYAVVVTTQPERDTFEDSQFEHALTLRTEAGVQIPDKYLIKASRLKDKAEIVKGIEAAEADPMVQQKKQLEMRGMEAEVAEKESSAQQKQADAQKKLSEANQPNDQNAEFVAKMQELDMEFRLKTEQMNREFELKKVQLDQEMQLERMKTDAKMALEAQQAEAKARLTDAQVTATNAQTAATIKTADAKAEAMKKAPAQAAAGGGQPAAGTDPGAEPTTSEQPDP
jgi:hypothetical protein